MLIILVEKMHANDLEEIFDKGKILACVFTAKNLRKFSSISTRFRPLESSDLFQMVSYSVNLVPRHLAK